MDYGKMAYLRLDELEQKLLFNTGAETKLKNTYAFIEPRRKIETQKGFFAARISGSGALSMIAKVCLDTSKTGTLILMLGRKAAGRINIADTGKSNELIINSVLSPDNTELSFEAEDGLETVIISAEIILTGNNARIERTADAVCMDSDGVTAALISGDDEQLCYSFGTNGTVLAAPRINIGYGIACDICAIADGEYIAVYADSALNLWGLKLNAGGEVYRRYLAANIKTAALTKSADNIIVAFTEGARAGYIVTDKEFLSRSERVYFDLPAKADNVMFVKNTAYPALIINCGKKSYLKTAIVPDGTDSAVLKIKTAFTVEEI